MRAGRLWNILKHEIFLRNDMKYLQIWPNIMTGKMLIGCPRGWFASQNVRGWAQWVQELFKKNDLVLIGIPIGAKSIGKG